jgi:glyoxylase-like metal-dependent hydrolase (beta-lactamase superfamily II)
MKVQVVPVTAFQQNCSVVWCERTRRAAVVDPGGDLERVLAVVVRNGLTLEKILVTHAHLDHAAATAELARRESLPIEGPHEGDLFWIEQMPAQAKMFGFPPSECFTPDRWLLQNDRVTVGEVEFEVRHCPGHTPGHVVFFQRDVRFAIVGDVIFAGSVGRSDLPRGNGAQLVRSIRENLFPLGDDVTFLPGHGPTSTFGEERRNNPFVADRLFAAAR